MIKLPLRLILLFLIPMFCNAQLLTLKFKKRKLVKFSSQIKTDTLFVVIENEKKPEDAALVNAVKNYWKQGKYKFISELEFGVRIKEKTIKNDKLFLYIARPFYNRTYNMTYGSFILGNNPCIRKKEAGFDYSLPNGGHNDKGKVLEGYYDLMVKYFDNETALVKDEGRRREIIRKRKKGITFFQNPAEIKNKDILYVKEIIGGSKDNNLREKSKNNLDLEKKLVKKYKADKARIFTVFPEDISLAIAKKDNRVLIFNGTELFDPADGAVKATSYSKDNYYFVAPASVLVIFGIWVTIVVITDE